VPGVRVQQQWMGSAWIGLAWPTKLERSQRLWAAMSAMSAAWVNAAF